MTTAVNPSHSAGIPPGAERSTERSVCLTGLAALLKALKASGKEALGAWRLALGAGGGGGKGMKTCGVFRGYAMFNSVQRETKGKTGISEKIGNPTNTVGLQPGSP